MVHTICKTIGGCRGDVGRLCKLSKKSNGPQNEIAPIQTLTRSQIVEADREISEGGMEQNVDESIGKDNEQMITVRYEI